MDVFKKFMAFPMFATATWLVWVLGQQTGVDGAGALLSLLVGFNMLLWSLALHGRVRAAVTTLSVVTLAALGSLVGPSVLRPTPAANQLVDATWQPWAPGKAEAIVAQGRPVFVDFTAAWCVTCQYNKLTTLADPALLTDFQAKNVTLLRADWTNRDPGITAALASLGRNGVPVYVLHRSGRSPVVLSEVISVDEVRAALSTL